jgi:hypothetical protein
MHSCTVLKISRFKLKITDPNRSIYSPYQTLKENQFFFFENFYYFFGQEKVAWFKDFESFNSDDFLPTKKIAKKFKKI